MWFLLRTCREGRRGSARVDRWRVSSRTTMTTPITSATSYRVMSCHPKLRGLPFLFVRDQILRLFLHIKNNALNSSNLFYHLPFWPSVIYRVFTSSFVRPTNVDGNGLSFMLIILLCRAEYLIRAQLHVVAQLPFCRCRSASALPSHLDFTSSQATRPAS